MQMQLVALRCVKSSKHSGLSMCQHASLEEMLSRCSKLHSHVVRAASMAA